MNILDLGPALYSGEGMFDIRVTNGAGVSVPSESRAYYFSDVYDPDSATPLNYLAPPKTLSQSLVRIDTSRQSHSDWTLAPLSVPARAEAGIVWIPTGEKAFW